MNQTQAALENRKEQNRIKTALVTAMPTGVYLHNIVIALATLLQEYTYMMLAGELKKWPGSDPLPEDGEHHD